jgi:zinc transport system substrate-binding protein
VFLRGPLDTLAGDAEVVELAKAHELVKLEFRESGPFDAHDHGDDDGHDDHHADDDHAGEDDGHDHAHDDHEDHADEHGHDHAHGVDMHFWLDPVNAKAFVQEIEEALVEGDAANAEAYKANAAGLNDRLDALIAETEKAVEPVKDKPFVVFHDAYQYFEKRFGIEASGSITVSPEAIPGAARLTELKAKIAELGVTCVFAEPQFEPRLISVVTEGTNARAGILDPLGADLADGPDLYFDLIRNMTTSLTECLSEAS